MISILDKKDCCGCSACAQRCPKKCISMKDDNEGFLYPIVNEGQCINCGLCEKVCPVINQDAPRTPLKVYAAKNVDATIRRSSSSGGIFPLLVEYVIKHDGVVFGARFNNNYDVEHDSFEHEEDAKFFGGSKYVQSNGNGCFYKVEQLLKEGKLVLYSGTQCQIAGLHLFLRKEYDKLLTVEVVCHGVPSPKIWKEYLSMLHIDKKKIRNILFKDKKTGWRGYSFTILGEYNSILYTEKAEKNKYMIAFYKNLTLRPSCYYCPAKGGKSHADITLADYWGIENINRKFNDNVGVSMVCCNSEKGNNAFNMISESVHFVETKYEDSIPFNSSIVKSTPLPSDRILFWDKYYSEGIDVLKTLKSSKPSIIKRLLNRINSIYK